jgi:hypothetical protein
MFILPHLKGLTAGNIGSAAFKSASLDLKFADNKSLTDAITGSNLVTFTRASSGTYVGSDGLIKTAVTNLLVRSEEFDQYGTLIDASLISNSATAPNGTLSADKLIEDTSDSAHKHRFIPSGADTYTTYSVYAKNAGRDLVLNAQNPGAGTYRVYFNLSTGTSTILANTSATGSHSITEIGDGWYRCSITYSFTESDAYYLDNSVGFSGSDTYTGDGTSGIYIWGAQLEQSATVGEYIPTTGTINSAPRFDHDPTTGESLGLLVEEQRTNSLLWSEDFSNWTVNNGSVQSNVITAPDGNVTADKLVENSSTGNKEVRRGSITFTSGTSLTYSCFVKASERSLFRLSATSAFFGSGTTAYFDLTSGTVYSTTGGVTSASIIPYPNGWYRCIATMLPTSSGTGSVFITLILSGDTSDYTGDGTSGIYLWGAQLEAGAFPTSYIPTTTAAVTRSADVASITGSNFSPWYNQAEGTVFADVASAPNNTIVQLVTDISDGSGSERMFIRRTGSGSLAFAVVDGAVTQADVGAGTVISGGARFAMAAAYRLNSVNLATNGQIGTEDTFATIPTSNRMFIAQNLVSAQQANGTIRRLTYWPQRLSNSTLQQITQ